MKKSRILAFSLLGLSLAAVASISLTVAWYIQGVAGQVEAVQLTLKSQTESLLISTSNEISTFKKTLTKDDLQHVEAFIPVSSAYSSSWIDAKSDTPKFVDAYTHFDEISQITYANHGFLSQNIYLYSEDDVTVTLDENLFSFLPNVEANEATYERVKDKFPGLSKEEIMKNLNNICKSLRCSILYKDETNYRYVIIDPYKNGDTFLGGILDSDNNGYYDYSALEQENLYGEYYNEDKIVYDEPSQTDIPYIGQLTCFNSGHKANVELFNKDLSIQNGFDIKKEQSVSLSQVTDALNIPVVEKKPTKIVFSLYLEGWDIDNTSLSMSASFLVDIAFKVKGEILL